MKRNQYNKLTSLRIVLFEKDHKYRVYDEDGRILASDEIAVLAKARARKRMYAEGIPFRGFEVVE